MDKVSFGCYVVEQFYLNSCLVDESPIIVDETNRRMSKEEIKVMELYISHIAAPGYNIFN